MFYIKILEEAPSRKPSQHALLFDSPGIVPEDDFRWQTCPNQEDCDPAPRERAQAAAHPWENHLASIQQPRRTLLRLSSQSRFARATDSINHSPFFLFFFWITSIATAQSFSFSFLFFSFVVPSDYWKPFSISFIFEEYKNDIKLFIFTVVRKIKTTLYKQREIMCVTYRVRHVKYDVQWTGASEIFDVGPLVGRRVWIAAAQNYTRLTRLLFRMWPRNLNRRCIVKAWTFVSKWMVSFFFYWRPL